MQLHPNPMPEKTAERLQMWDAIFQDKNHHVIVAEENGYSDNIFVVGVFDIAAGGFGGDWLPTAVPVPYPDFRNP